MMAMVNSSHRFNAGGLNRRVGGNCLASGLRQWRQAVKGWKCNADHISTYGQDQLISCPLRINVCRLGAFKKSGPQPLTLAEFTPRIWETLIAVPRSGTSLSSCYPPHLPHKCINLTPVPETMPKLIKISQLNPYP